MATTLDDIAAKLDRIISLLEALVIQNERSAPPKHSSEPGVMLPTHPPQYLEPVRFDQPGTEIPQWVPPTPTTCKEGMGNG